MAAETVVVAETVAGTVVAAVVVVEIVVAAAAVAADVTRNESLGSARSRWNPGLQEPPLHYALFKKV